MKAWILMVLALLLPAAAMAEEAKEGVPKVAYISLSPPFVGNYALDGSPRLRVYKADVALRVTGDEAAKTVKHHEPLIRNPAGGTVHPADGGQHEQRRGQGASSPRGAETGAAGAGGGRGQADR